LKVLSRPPERKPLHAGESAIEEVRKIIAAVRRRKDAALRPRPPSRGRKKPPPLAVPRKQWAAALRSLARPQFQALELTFRQAGRIARKQRAALRSFGLRPSPGWNVSQEIRPLRSVAFVLPPPPGPAVPIITACAIPAAVAGVPQRIICAPPGPDKTTLPPMVLAAAHMVEASALFRVSGPAALAALSLGTRKIPVVDKIVATADEANLAAFELLKDETACEFAFVGAGELAILAEDPSTADLLTAELIAHLERAPASVAGLVTPSRPLARKVTAGLKSARPPKTPKGKVYVVHSDTLEKALALLNQRAPEQLWLLAARPGAVAKKLTQYGALYVGPHASPLLSEGGMGTTLSPAHASGPSLNHGPVGVSDFVRFTTVYELARQNYGRLGRALQAITRAEDRKAAVEAIQRRLDQDVIGVLRR
jgi:histidinol dehydrogenase